MQRLVSRVRIGGDLISRRLSKCTHTELTQLFWSIEHPIDLKGLSANQLLRFNQNNFMYQIQIASTTRDQMKGIELYLTESWLVVGRV
jgi:hypothetical protein